MFPRPALVLSIGFAVVSSACGGLQSASPTTPTTVAAAQPLPAGTIAIRGTVGDTAFRHLAGARVEVLDGPLAGTITTSDGRGEFMLVGAFPENTRFRASMDGHVTGVATLLPFCERCNPNHWVHLYLDAVAAPVAVNGTYTLTFTIDNTCAGFPAELRERNYTATVPVRTDQFFDIAVSGARFAENFNSFQGGVAGDYVAFWMEPLAEQVSDNSFLLFSMSASGITTTAPGVIEAVGDGDISYCVLNSATGFVRDCWFNPGSVRSVCRSRNHRLTFTRR